MTTANEDVRDSLQIIAKVSARPAVKTPPGTPRGTLIAYGELTNLKKRLTEVLAKLETEMHTHGVHGDGFVCADPEDDGGWRVSWNQRLTSPRFNSYGAASAYMELLASGKRAPEYSE